MESKVYNTFKIVILLLFIIFVTLFFASYTGYYDYENKQKALLTEAQIKKFDDDIKNGVAIDMEPYLTNPNVNYQNNVANLGSKFSNIISNMVSKSVDKTFSFLIKFVEQ